MLNFIRAGVEYKLKKEILNGSNEKMGEIKKKREEIERVVVEKEEEINESEWKIRRYKEDVERGYEVKGEEKIDFKKNLVDKYKMTNKYGIVSNKKEEGSKIILKSIKPKMIKKGSLSNNNNMQISDKHVKNPSSSSSSNKNIINIISGNKLGGRPLIESLSSPKECEEYIERYLHQDLRAVGLGFQELTGNKTSINNNNNKLPQDKELSHNNLQPSDNKRGSFSSPELDDLEEHPQLVHGVGLELTQSNLLLDNFSTRTLSLTSHPYFNNRNTRIMSAFRTAPGITNSPYNTKCTLYIYIYRYIYI